MIKVCYALRIAGVILAVGAMGSLELDTIDYWTWFLQTMLGVTLWFLTGYWLEEVQYYKKEKSAVKSFRRSFSGLCVEVLENTLLVF